MQTIAEPKRGLDVGRVVASVRIENADDIRRAEGGEIPLAAVRSTVVEALVDTGTMFLCLPAKTIQELGLPFHRMRGSRTVTGPKDLRIFTGARIEIHDRSCDVEVMELPDSVQPLLGQIPLEILDYWVDLANRRLVGNPEHDGHCMAEV